MNHHVSSVAVGECLTKIPRQQKVKTNAYQKCGILPVIDQGSSFIGGYVDDPALAYSGPLPVVVFGDHNRNIKFVKNRFAVGADGTQLLYPDDRFDVVYFYYALKALPLKNYGYERHFKYLKEEHVLEWPKPVQRRIASVLSAYDDLIENNTRRIAILEEMARRIYEEWFVRFRFPGHENVRMVASESGLVPMEWHSATLGSVCAYINRGLAPKYDDDAPGVVINQKCIRDQRLSFSAARRQSKAVPKEKLIVPGDVLINSTGVGTLGRVAQVLEPVESCTVDTHISIVRPSSSIDKDFFGMAMLHKQSHFEAQGVGSTGQTELSRGRIADTGILLPPQVLQAQFGNLVSPMRQLAVRLQCKNANLRATRDFLLPKLISGELDVSDLPEPEAAAA